MVWMRYNRERFRAKCQVSWCKNTITPFAFEVGHNIPESKGGSTTLDNLMPICSSCNRSMGNNYSITEYSEKFADASKKEKSSPFKGMFKRFIDKLRCFGEQ